MTAVLKARGVVKSFGHVEVRREVDFSAYAGKGTALIGDNGAGKSTHIKFFARGGTVVRVNFALDDVALPAGTPAVLRSRPGSDGVLPVDIAAWLVPARADR